MPHLHHNPLSYGMTKKYALIGYPLQHSFSPGMHNAGFHALGIDAHYSLLEIPTQKETEEFIQNIHSSGYAGFNVTVPYKSLFLAEVPDVYRCSDEAACDIGAVNTVIIKDGVYAGYNTDWYGFLKGLEIDLAFLPQGKNILLVGTGGAGKACLFALLKSGAACVTISDIDEMSAQVLKQSYVDRDSTMAERIVVISSRELCNEIKDYDLIVNATSCGMKGQDPEVIPEDRLPSGKACVYDVIYNPAETRLLRAAKAKGLKTANGLRMLLYQGIRAFELWTGKEAPVAVMEKALLKQLEERIG